MYLRMNCDRLLLMNSLFPFAKFVGALAPGAVMVTACGGTVSPPLLCGSGSDVVFGYQVVADETRVEPGEKVLWENGVEFLFIDSSCKYWSYYLSEKQGRWSDIRHGTLTTDQLKTINRELIQRDWTAIAETPALPSGVNHPGGIFLWNQADVGVCTQPCTSSLEPLAKKAAQLTRELFESGVAPDESAPLRWTVLDVPGLEHPFPLVEWSGTALGDVAVVTEDPDGNPEDYIALTFGGHQLVPVADTTLLRALRDEFRNKTHDSFWYGFLPLTDKGRTYKVYARDTLPFENERGLVRPPQ